jgi:acetyltransferase-like isoleucine patch superfamily enzyme
MNKLGFAAVFCLLMGFFAVSEELVTYLDRNAVSDGEENARRNLRAIEEWAFAYGDLTAVNIPEGITVIGKGAFANNALSSVALPKSLQTIDGWAFAHNNISAVVFPESVAFVGEYAFLGNRVSDITLGNDVYVSPDAVDNGFYDCYNKALKTAGRYILKDGVWLKAPEK